MKTHKGLEYAIHPHLGSLCGYVKLPDDHPFCKSFKKENVFGRNLELGYDDMNIDCHGGLTFSRIVSEEDSGEYPQGFTPGYWIGWDYIHVGDSYDCGMGRMFKEDKIWSFAEVERECKNVIEQVLDKNKTPVLARNK